MTTGPTSYGGPLRKVLVIGCGEHYFSRYHPVIESITPAAEIVLAVDLEPRRRQVNREFLQKRLQPEAFLFLPESMRFVRSEHEVEALLAGAVDTSKIDAVLVCTEPRSHRAFASWAMSHEVAVFMDKPFSAVPLPAPDGSILRDYEYLEAVSRRTGTACVVSCERRAHPGFRYAKQELIRLMNEFYVPITSVHVSFNGGNWIYPNEFLSQENHPFRYGYGVLFHSGYHYVDTIAAIAELSVPTSGLDVNSPCVQVLARRPRASTALCHMATVRNPDFAITTFIEHAEDWAEASALGEVDLAFMGTYPISSDNGLLFTGQLLESSVSGRRPGAGRGGDFRIRSEQLVVNLSHLATLTLSANSYRKLDTPEEPEDFTMTIAYSPAISDEGVVRLDRADLSRLEPDLPLTSGVNGWARQRLLENFLNGDFSASDIYSHRATAILLSQLTDCLSCDIHALRDEKPNSRKTMSDLRARL
jgi:predicted dehydrogenase